VNEHQYVFTANFLVKYMIQTAQLTVMIITISNISNWTVRNQSTAAYPMNKYKKTVQKNQKN